MAYKEGPQGPKTPEQNPQSGLETLDQEVQVQAYKKMMESIEARYTVSLGNTLKGYIEKEFVQKGKKALPNCIRTVEDFNTMWDSLPKMADKLGVRASTEASRLVESATNSGIMNPEQIALIQLLAIKKGINATLQQEYSTYISQLNIPDILAKYHELTD